MKVLQINAVYRNGSTGRNVQELHEWLKAHGVQSYAAAAIFDDSDRDEIYPVGNKADRKLHAFLSRVSGKQGYFSYVATLRLISYIKQLRPDVVHLHNFHSNYLNLDMLLGFLAENRIATAVTLHDCFAFTGKCFHFGSCMKWKENGCENCAERQSIPPAFGIFEKSQRMFEDKKSAWSRIPALGVIGVSDWITDAAKDSMLKGAKEIRRIYNWIDTDTFRPSANPLLAAQYKGEGKHIVLAVAPSFSSEKGLDDIIALSERLDNTYSIILAGRMPEAIRLPQSVVSVGRIESSAELAQLYSLADVYINPSVRETFGKVTAEALACGTPAVVYNTTACPELIGEGCGAVVPLGDTEAMAQKVAEIVAAGKSAYTDKCVKFASDNFSLEKAGNEHLSFYSELLR